MTDHRAPRVFDVADQPVTVYVLAPDGRVLDVIEDVDLGDRRSARERGRITLWQACQFAAIITDRYRELTAEPEAELVEIPSPLPTAPAD